MSDFYQNLLDGLVSIEEVTDDQLDTLKRGWEDDGVLLPTAEIWKAAHDETRNREIKRAEKRPIDRDFFK